MNQTKKRLVYWVTDIVTPRHHHLAAILQSRGFELSFQRSISSLTQAAAERRSGILIVDDEGVRQVVEKNIIAVMNAPEFQGARLVLSTSNRYAETLQHAAWGNFRDIIPLDLDDQLWLRRFMYATSSKASEFPESYPQMTLSNFAQVAVPARISWITEDKICIESKAAPSIGTNLHLHGRLAAALGVSSLSVTVESTQRHNLLYRFSDAIVGTWKVPDAMRERTDKFISSLRQKNPAPRIRVYAAIQQTKTRQAIVERLAEPKFEVKMALQKQAIIDEPKYFSPDLIFLEDALFQEDHGTRFRKMLKGLTQRIAIVVIGNSVSRDILKDMANEHRVIVIPRLPQELADAVLRRFLGSSHRLHAPENRHLIQLAPMDGLTFAEIHAPARLSALHPFSVKVLTPFPMGNYGLMRLESPMLAKVLTHALYVKITSGRFDETSGSQFIYSLNCNLANIGKVSKSLLAKFLAATFSEYMLQLEKSEGSLVADVEPATALVQNHPSDEQKLLAAISEAAKVKTELPDIAISRSPQMSAAAKAETPKKAFPRRSQLAPLQELFAGFSQPAFRYFILFVMFCSFVGVGLWLIVSVVAPDWHKSGSQYTESLKKMTSPGHTLEEEKPASEQGH